MSNAHCGSICAHERAAETPLYIDDPWSYQIRVYNKLLEQQTNSANPIPAGVKSWVRS